uniref:Uncharacterized protein n=1 Tax=Arundo donax TaxID=35708 RepID=A0A0A8ZAC1_ARUDO
MWPHVVPRQPRIYLREIFGTTMNLEVSGEF